MPALHLLAGPNGSGKTTFWQRVLGPATRLPFVNADLIARDRWPGEESSHAYEAAAVAADRRAAAVAARRSFSAETVFSHPSKLSFVKQAKDAGYQVTLHVMLIPEELAVARARLREQQGGHAVPEHKVRERYARLWALVADAIAYADEAFVYDNSRAAKPFVIVARYHHGQLVQPPQWPSWSPLPVQPGPAG